MKNPFRKIRLQVLILAAGLLLGIPAAILHAFNFGELLPGGDLVKGAAGVSLKEELNIGQSIALEIAARKGGILKDDAMTKRVARVGQALVLYSDRPSLDFNFIVLNSDEVNALSAPGGYVFVTKGLVDSCKTDRELAGVLGHEIAHITRRHALKLISGKKTGKGVIQVLSLSGVTPGEVAMFEDLIVKAAESIVDKGLPKSDEYDADKVGTLLTWHTGFPPPTLRDYLKSLQETDRKRTFSTHPAIKDRVKRLDEIVGEIE
jgi:beta-barrel assembly-enhancing protease